MEVAYYIGLIIGSLRNTSGFFDFFFSNSNFPIKERQN